VRAEQVVLSGFALVFLGVLVIIAGSIMAASSQKSDVKFAVGGFLGFIPFGFANDRRLLFFVLAVSLVFFLLFVLNIIALRRGW